MATITELVQAYHDDGLTDAQAMDAAAADILEKISEDYRLEYSSDTEAQVFAVLMRQNIKNSVDWQQIAEDDQNAKDWLDARDEALRR